MTPLALRSVGSNDFVILDDGYPVGRIRLAAERRGEVWYWNVTIPVRGCGHGSGDSLEEAKSAFSEGRVLRAKINAEPTIAGGEH